MARAKKTRRGRVQLDDMPGQSDPSAPIDGAQLLAAARPVLDELRADLAARANESAALTAALRARYEDEKKAMRTADGFAAWVDSRVAQVAASWFLSCVFVRTLEDRGLLGQNRLAGPGATDSQSLFFELGPSLTERDYLLFVFRELSELPAAAGLFDREHALVWQLSPSAEAAKKLLRLFRMPRADEPAFRFGQGSTRFLGDLYQDLYEDVRKRYALLQTPDFVESFILDRTLEPAIDRFGLGDTTIIDPTCGSGHFLLGAFERLFQHRLAAEPGLDVASAAKQALDAVYGADINPYAVAIAKFRLTLAYLEKAGTAKLATAPELPLHVVVADSLLHNPHKPQTELEHVAGQSTEAWRTSDAFRLEDEAASRDILHRQFAAVVGNPPYIVPKDRFLRRRYAEMYPTCHMNYALSVPFCERFFQLARKTGFVGQITANSFMKREFGKKLIQHYLPSLNIELVVNTSGAYIPGHGTPTVLLFGTQEAPVESEVLTVLAKRGEPSTPADPAKGKVWSSIAENWSDLGFENDYVSIVKTKRDRLAAHPWSLAGGGASALKELLESRAQQRLSDVIDDVGFSIILGEDDVYKRPAGRRQWSHLPRMPLVIGEEVRDWSLAASEEILRPFDPDSLNVSATEELERELWPWRSILRRRIVSGSATMDDANRHWFDVRRLSRDKHRWPLSIAFAFVATHNHFVLDRGGKVFNRSAPIIKLPETATEDDHLALLAYLNSSTACFWMKQVFHKKSSASQKHHTDPARAAYEFAGTGLKGLPIPSLSDPQLRETAKRISDAASRRSLWLSGKPAVDVLLRLEANEISEAIQLGWQDYDSDTSEAAYLQEELDWLVYKLFGLWDGPCDFNSQATSTLGNRPFEKASGYSAGLSDRITGDRPQVSKGNESGPAHWEDRLAASQGTLALLETRACKRMWRDTEQNVDQQQFRRALEKRWLEDAVLNAIEDFCRGEEPRPFTPKHLIGDLEKISSKAATVLNESSDLLVTRICADNSVPFLAAYRYSAKGNLRHQEWQEVWSRQRTADLSGEGDAAISPPPKYGQSDFADPRYWRLRGKLDVPKERFISYPGCESDEDREPVYGWAGWNHLQRAQALANLYQKRKTEEGWDPPRLIPMLAGLQELIPWLHQYHNTPDPAFNGLRMGYYFQDFLTAELAHHSLTPLGLTTWRPRR